MELQPPGTPVRDPFFAAVRRRHPDLDLVLLPGDPDPAAAQVTAAEPVDDVTVAESLERVSAAARLAWAAATRESEEMPEPRISFGPTVGTVVARARIVTQAADGFHVLVGLRSHLEQQGWELRQRSGPVELISGRWRDLQVRATYAESTGALVLELTSAPMSVGAASARAMAGRP